MKIRFSEDEAKTRVIEDPDFINSPKYNNSLNEFCKTHEDGVKDSQIARLLMMAETEVAIVYAAAVQKLKSMMGG